MKTKDGGADTTLNYTTYISIRLAEKTVIKRNRYRAWARDLSIIKKITTAQPVDISG